MCPGEKPLPGPKLGKDNFLQFRFRAQGHSTLTLIIFQNIFDENPGVFQPTVNNSFRG